MTRRDYTIRDIHMALDGEMPAEDRAGYEAWLATNPDMKAASLRFSTDRARLKSAFEAVSEPCLTVWRNARGHPSASAGFVRLVARIPWKPAVATALRSCECRDRLLRGRIRRATDRTGRRRPWSSVPCRHMSCTPPSYVVPRSALTRDHLVGWLSKRVGTPLVAPDLSADGYQLVGGRSARRRPGHLPAQFIPGRRHSDIALRNHGIRRTPKPASGSTGGRCARVLA
jgi:anti-sigma factor RsiW